MVDINDMWDDEEDNEMMRLNMGIVRKPAAIAARPVVAPDALAAAVERVSAGIEKGIAAFNFKELRLILAALREKDAQADRDRARIEALEEAVTIVAQHSDDKAMRIMAARTLAALANTASDKEQTDGHE